MNLKKFPCDDLVANALRVGVDAIAVVPSDKVPRDIVSKYNNWLLKGYHADMGYLEKYPELRLDPAGLLPGVASVICCAVSYRHSAEQPDGVPAIAHYAHGDDYHEVVRKMLEEVTLYIRQTYGGETRVCVDTAPFMERYWAVASGLGFRGKSGLVIVPGLGTYCFLGEILTTVPFEARRNTRRDTCDYCGACIVRCPGNAIGNDGLIDARRCLSYLTIEYRGDLPEGFSTGGRLYGCDECQKVCPHNRDIALDRHSEFDLRKVYKRLSADVIENMSPEDFSTIFRHSAIKRAKLSGLKRNVEHL